MFLNVCVAQLPVKRDIETKFLVFLILDMYVQNKKSGISSLYIYPKVLQLVN